MSTFLKDISAGTFKGIAVGTGLGLFALASGECARQSAESICPLDNKMDEQCAVILAMATIAYGISIHAAILFSVAGALIGAAMGADKEMHTQQVTP